MLVTTSYNPSPAIADKAHRIADQLAGKWVPRGRHSIARLRHRYGHQGVLLLDETERLTYYPDQDSALFFHPSSAHVRIKRMLQGGEDPMIELAGAEPGDSVLDCTAGLASDAIVFSFRTGREGRVTALESENILCYLVRHGLTHYRSDMPELNEAMSRITMECADHLAYMRRMPDRSVDIVYFDPMFRKPVDESSAIDPMRAVANGTALRLEAVREAARIARKSVVLKELKSSREFSRLGFRHVHRSYSKIAYGVIRI